MPAAKVSSSRMQAPQPTHSTRKPTYIDFSTVKTEDVYPLFGGTNASKDITFALRLHHILSNPDLEHIISWLPHGRAWRIHQKQIFEREVIPTYFHHCRFTSFMRQVSGWGFRRVTSGNDSNAYFHEKFLRGMPHLCSLMRRLKASDAKQIHQKCSLDDFSNYYKICQSSPILALPSNRVCHNESPPSLSISLSPVPLTPVLPSMAERNSSLCMEPSTNGKTSTATRVGSYSASSSSVSVLSNMIPNKSSSFLKPSISGKTSRHMGLDLASPVVKIASPPSDCCKTPLSPAQTAAYPALLRSVSLEHEARYPIQRFPVNNLDILALMANSAEMMLAKQLSLINLMHIQQQRSIFPQLTGDFALRGRNELNKSADQTLKRAIIDDEWKPIQTENCQEYSSYDKHCRNTAHITDWA